MTKKLAVLAVTAAMAAAMAFAGPASADVIRFDDDRADLIEERAEIIEDYYEALGLDVDEEDVILHHYYSWGPLGWWF